MISLYTLEEVVWSALSEKLVGEERCSQGGGRHIQRISTKALYKERNRWEEGADG